MFERFKIRGTPTDLIVDKTGKEIDWRVGYGPPPDRVLEWIKKALAGTDTYADLSARYAKDPTNVDVAFKLAAKTAERGTPEMEAQSKQLYEKILTMNLQGQTASYYDEDYKATIPYVEAAQFALAQTTVFGRKADPAPMLKFVKDHPDSPMTKTGYRYLSYYYGQIATQEAADKFYDEYNAKFPGDRDALAAYVERIIKDKGPVDKGVIMAEKLKKMAGYPPNPAFEQYLADLYILKGDPAKADDEYGKDFFDTYASNTYYSLISYADFWADQGRNLESAEAAADLAMKLKPDDWFAYAQTAGVYAKVGKDDKALAAYGPDFVKKFANEQLPLVNYAIFWTNAGKNLDSALEATRRAVELAPDYFNYFWLGQVLFKLKKYDEALNAAQKAVDLVKPLAAKNASFPVQRYEKLVKDIQEAQAKK
jgi:tetratricopeptide (TPR) repeat protein